MNDLVRAGTILYWGVSEWNADQIAAAATLCAARGWTPPISNQPQYSALWRRVEERVFRSAGTTARQRRLVAARNGDSLRQVYVDAGNPPAGTRAASVRRKR